MRINYLKILFFISISLGLNPWILKAIQQTKEPIKIGLLIPDNKSLAALQGAELAIRLANKKTGSAGIHFNLVVKSLEGPWGTGSKQAVSLIFDDKVCAIMGSCDGRNAHLIEQAATRATVVFMSAWASDPTLAEAFVPWFFNCVPNDNQQADALIKEIYIKRKLGKIAVISDSTYDSKMACNSFIKRSMQAGKQEPLKISFNNDPGSLTNQFKKIGAEGLVLFGNVKSSALLIGRLKTLNFSFPVFGNLALLDEEQFSEKDFGNVIFVSSGSFSQPEANYFRKDYQKLYGTIPGPIAELAFDGMNLLIQAISRSGTDRESIQKALLNIKSEGVTGTIKFDEKGNRVGNLLLVKSKNGELVPVEKY
jgi:branched-chain amino acid transport system substrate-binding protein